MVRTRQPASRISMPPAPVTLRLSAYGRLRRCALLSGMGISLAALVATPDRALAAGPAFGTPAWAASRGAPGANSSPASIPGGGGINANGPLTTPDQALARTQRSMADLSRAAAQIAAAQSAQNAAIALAASIPNTSVPNGLTPGGLVVAVDAATNAPALTNVQAPTQKAVGAGVEVTVKQTAQKAIVGWSSFNVGQNTTLHFDQTDGKQTDGSNNWVVLNRIADPSAKPSQILGQIKAEGSVYLLNNNGIVFGAGSQVNTHSLLASTLNLYSNDVATADRVFLDPNQGLAAFTALPQGEASATNTALLDPGRDAAISIAQGASLRSGANGQIIVAAPTIANAGSLRADDGQAIVYAARNLRFLPTTVGSTRSDTLLTPAAVVPSARPSSEAGTQLVNTGLIQAARGNVSLYGNELDQNGVVAVSTSTVSPGSISIGGNQVFASRVSFGASLTTVLPDSTGPAATSSASASAAFKTGAITVTASAVRLDRGALVEAPGANLSISSSASTIRADRDAGGQPVLQGRVFVDDGAILDVAGLADVQLAHDATLVTIPRIGQNELADSPVQRDGFLFRQTNVVIDSTISGVRSDGTPWIGSPILNAQGYADAVPRQINALLVNAGSITLSAPEVITQQGSLLNLDAGYIHYLAGSSGGTSRLQTVDGHLYDVSRADPMYRYAGYAGSFVQRNARFGLTRTYVDPLIGGRLRPEDPGYIAGGRAGTLTIVTPTQASATELSAVLLAGDISAQGLAGRQQVLAGQTAAGGSLVVNSVAALVLRDAPVTLDSATAPFERGTALTTDVASAQDPANRLNWSPISIPLLQRAGFSNVALTSNAQQILVQAGNGLQVQDGGSITLTAARVEVDANLSARSGRIAISSGGAATTGVTFLDPASTARPVNADLVIGAGVTLSTAGRFVNDSALPVDARSGPALLNGGSITLTALASVSNALVSGSRTAGTAGTTLGPNLDSVGSIRLGAGSLLDVSGGGYVDAGGVLAGRGGVPAGSGGSIGLIVSPVTGVFQTIGVLERAQADGGRILADGALRDHLAAYGFSGGGTLSLRGLGVQIGGDAAIAAQHEALYLDPGFFNGQGFANYRISGAQDVVVAAGTELVLRNRNLIPDLTAILSAPSGTRLQAPGQDSGSDLDVRLGELDAFRRTPTSLSLSAGDYLGGYLVNSTAPRNTDASGTVLLDAGASITADPGAAVTLRSLNQVTVLGSITAQGGRILLSGDSGAPGDRTGYAGDVDPQTVIYSSLSKSVWLGADARIDASGVSLLDPLASPVAFGDGELRLPRTGRVLAGGSVTLSNDTGAIVAERGSLIDVSGAKDRFDLPEATGSVLPGFGFRYGSSADNVYSDAGSITLGAAGGLLYDGSFAARGGSAEARGGSLRITAESNLGVSRSIPLSVNNSGTLVLDFGVSAKTLILRQSGDSVPVGLRPGDELEAGSESPNNGVNRVQSGNLQFAVDRLAGSGIENLSVGQDTQLGVIGRPRLVIGFSGDVDLSLPGALTLSAPSYEALPAGSVRADGRAPSDTGASAVHLSAAYVNFGGDSYGSQVPIDTSGVAGDATLKITAQRGIDLTGTAALLNFADTRFATAGDLRFISPSSRSANTRQTVAQTLPGLLYSAGDLGFEAAQVYPVSGETFAVLASGPNPTAIRFTQAAGARAATPLSAGGRLLLDATTIEQNGSLRAPSGSLLIGVGDPADATTQALFAGAAVDGALPLVATQSVTLGAASLTSVSLDGQTVPYGVTVDGKQYRYDAISAAQRPSTASLLDGAPAKQVQISAAGLALAGGTVDLSGGGDLLAQEFVPGTGGTRDVLARRYTSTDGLSTINLFPDARPVYAIVPAASLGALGAYDPAFDTALTGASAGQAAGPLVGKAVHLSGVGTLKEGDYILLPARYAVLPGAYRVVQNTGVTDALAALNTVLPDGSYLSAGYFTDAITRTDGSTARDARTTRFIVQSNAVWQQYSQYTLTGANQYFLDRAAKADTVASALPVDAGQLVLAATKTLDFGATIKAAGSQFGQRRGNAAQVDIASRDIQIVGGSAATALDGYVQLDSGSLNAIGSASLLIGGTRTRGSAGDQISAIANSIVVSNDGSSALSGPELLLVTRTDPNAGTANADTVAVSSGVRLDANSAIQASGMLAGAGSAPILLSGDGTLLRVSNGEAVSVTRSGTSASGGTANLELLAGASIAGGKALVLDSSASVNVDPTARFAAQDVRANAATISFVADDSSSAPAGLVIGSVGLGQLAASDSVTLQSRGAIGFFGDVAVSLPKALNLVANRYVSDGGTAHISSASLSLAGTAIAPDAAEAGGGSLILDTGALVLGAGSTVFSGFGSVSASASRSVLGQGTGRFDFGAAGITLATPLLAADTGSNTSLFSSGALTVNALPAAAGTPAMTAGGIGGRLDLRANAVTLDTAVSAPAGIIAVTATGGDLSLGGQAKLSVAGVAKAFYDVTRDVDAGSITLRSDVGALAIDPLATLDVSAASGGGAAGSLSLVSLGSTGTLSRFGRLVGTAAAGQLGGSLSLDTGGAVDLDALSQALTGSGITQGLRVHTRSGNLSLAAGNSLRAADVSLIADGAGADGAVVGTDGNVRIAGTIDASGIKGGSIALVGRNGVDLEGRLIATGSSKTERGGTVAIATSGSGDGSVDATYGYQNISTDRSGTITLGSSASIDVSGGSAGGLSNGTLSLRAPLLAGGELNLALASSTAITGARSVDVEAYAVWDTADASTGLRHFDGTIDPLAANSGGFYTTTLSDFVSQGAFGFENRLAGIANLRVRPGIELRNGSGDITVANAWNLGAVTLDGNGNVASNRYRHEGAAPVLTLRAAGNLRINASLTDGFVQLSNPLGLQAARLITQEQLTALYSTFKSAYPDLAATVDAPTIFTPDGSDTQAQQIAQYYGLYEQYLNYLLYGRLPVGSLDAKPANPFSPATTIETAGIASLGLGAPVRPASAQGYADYLVQYAAYLDRRSGSALGGRIAPPAAPRAVLASVFTGAAIGGPVDNSASPVATGSNPLPIASAVLAGGDSSRYRLVAGADASSAEVMALMPESRLDATGGDVLIDGHLSYTDPVTKNVVLQGTMVRTGTGSIQIAAGRDFRLLDTVVPGTVYTAGAPTAGRYASTGSGLLKPALAENLNGPIAASLAGEFLTTGAVQPDAAGDLSLRAQRDIRGVEAAQRNDSTAGQLWWEWLQTGNDFRYSLDSSHHASADNLQVGYIAGVNASSINFGSFGQGLLSVGGDVAVSAGGTISQLSVSLPTTWYLDRTTGSDILKVVGGGDLRVSAGADILSGSYFVSSGTGRIRAGGEVGSSLRAGFGSLGSDLGTILAVQDAQIDLAARSGAIIAGAYNPSYLPSSLPTPIFGNDSRAYSADSGVSVATAAGDLRFGSLSLDNARSFFLVGTSDGYQISGEILPAHLDLAAITGAISIEKSGELFPSANGTLNVLASGSITLSSATDLRAIVEPSNANITPGRYFGLIDADPALLPSPTNPITAAAYDSLTPSLQRKLRYISNQSSSLLHSPVALHGADYDPVRIYSLAGDITTGPTERLANALVLAPDKAALIYAGRDIVNLSLQGQHVHDSDITRLVAGRDILDTFGGTPGLVSNPSTRLQGTEPSLVLSGPGTFELSAGRDLGPLTNQTEVVASRLGNALQGVGTAPITGITSIGNLINPYLPHRSADIVVSFGVAPGTAQDAFIDRYINPANAAALTDLPGFGTELVDFVRQYRRGLAVDTGFVKDVPAVPPAPSAEQAFTAFRALPDYVQRLFVNQVLFEVLRITAADFGNPDSPYANQYARGYQALSTLFPSSLGYTANNLLGGANGATSTVSTGDLDLRGTTIQTQQGGLVCRTGDLACTPNASLGGNISILGPGGQAIVGSTSAPPVTRDANGNTFAGPGTQGILTLEQGDIRIFTDRSLLLAQSRVFTEQGGSILIWSSNGDVNAGRGARTTADTPAPSYLCNNDFYCIADARGAVTGAGIATLQTVPGAPSGDVFLVAPRGTVDAGDAGIRVSGNLVVAAQAVANADNIQVQGSAIGLKLSAIDSGTLSAGSQAAAAAQQQAASLTSRPVDRASTVITVEVYGFGTPDEQQKKKLRGGSN